MCLNLLSMVGELHVPALVGVTDTIEHVEVMFGTTTVLVVFISATIEVELSGSVVSTPKRGVRVDVCGVDVTIAITKEII